MRITLTILILWATLPVFGQGARTLLFDRTNLTVAVPESGFFESNRVDIGNALKNPAIVDTMADLRSRTPRSNEIVGVRKYSSTVPFSVIRWFHHDATNALTRDGTHYETNAAASGRYVALDRVNAEQQAAAFGVVADGTTECSTELQNAVNYCYSNNIPSLLLPVGTIVANGVTLTGALDIGGLAIRGDPGLRTILKSTSTNSIFSFAALRNLQINHVWFDGNTSATNIVQLDNCTHATFNDCAFYRPNGSGVRMTGVQNYGHVFKSCNFVNFSTAGVVFDGVSTAANTVENCVFQSFTSTNAIGAWAKIGSIKNVFRDTIFQNLNYGVYLDGNSGGIQLGTDILSCYFEKCSTASIGLGADLHVQVNVQNCFFNTQFTTNGWSMVGATGSTLYGFNWSGNTITPDAGKAFDLSGAAVRGWTVTAGPTDIATDYSLPGGKPFVFNSPSQRLISLISTNYDASSSTNYQIAGDLLPNLLHVSSSSNIAVSIIGYTYSGSELTIRNTGTNQVVFAGTLDTIYQGQEQHFIHNGTSWVRTVLPYLPDSIAATMRGNLTISTNLSVGGTSAFTGNANFSGLVENPWGYLTYGSFGSTNVVALAAKSGAMIGFLKDSNYYMLIGTNGGTRFETDVTIAPNKGLSLGGTLYTNWPTGSGGIGGVSVNGSGVASNAVNSPLLSAIRTNGDFSFTATSTTGSGNTLVLSDSPTLTGTVTGDTVVASSFVVTNFSAFALSAGRVSVTNEAYGTGWNGSTNVPTRDDVYDQMELKSPLASPAFTGIPTAPTASTSVSNTQVATTAFAQQLASASSGMFTLLIGNNATATFTTNTTHLAPRLDSRVWAGGLTWDQSKVAVPINCRIVGLGLRFRVSTIASPTGSNYVWSIRTNDVADVNVLTNSWPDSAAHASATSFSPINLNAGDAFAVKLTMPAWLSTAPVAGGVIDVYVERR